MLKWLAIAGGLSVLALGAILLMKGQDSGDWGTAASHLPSGSAAHLEANPTPAPPKADELLDGTTSSTPPPAAAPAMAPPAGPSVATAAPKPPPTPPQKEAPKTAAAEPTATTHAPAPAANTAATQKDTRPNVVHVTAAWVREPAEYSLSTTGYMVITNEGPAPDRLLSVSSPVAKTVTIENEGSGTAGSDMSKLEFEAGVPRVFEPGGYEFKLDGLRHPLAPGLKITIFLIFEKAGTVPVSALVGEPGLGSSQDGSG